MGFFGSPAAPPPPVIPPVPPAAHAPVLGSALSAMSVNANKKAGATAAGAGFDNTIGTSPQGLQDKANTAPATLLGQ